MFVSVYNYYFFVVLWSLYHAALNLRRKLFVKQQDIGRTKLHDLWNFSIYFWRLSCWNNLLTVDSWVMTIRETLLLYDSLLLLGDAFFFFFGGRALIHLLFCVSCIIWYGGYPSAGSCYIFLVFNQWIFLFPHSSSAWTADKDQSIRIVVGLCKSKMMFWARMSCISFFNA